MIILIKIGHLFLVSIILNKFIKINVFFIINRIYNIWLLCKLVANWARYLPDFFPFSLFSWKPCHVRWELRLIASWTVHDEVFLQSYGKTLSVLAKWKLSHKLESICLTPNSLKMFGSQLVTDDGNGQLQLMWNWCLQYRWYRCGVLYIYDIPSVYYEGI